ncbi:hypothetical protein TUM17387_26040 [Shewanella carassii]|uniref:hypothetical protein n=1 Tax=Shewanella carassii TaxID=1987584 RepID=UPI001BEEA6EE|nr:hypothetical protein [Shewanella carassii]BCV67245.1 hypothetical protein TUM17387_26040 [Shewanella carassii]
MSYELSFYKTNLDKIKEIIASEDHEEISNGKISEIINSNCEYMDGICHSSGCSGYFAEYVTTIAGDYFSEPTLYDIFMSRDDLMPSLPDTSISYIKHSEIEGFIAATQNKYKEIYFEDNDDFEEDLDIVEDVFKDALRDNKDIICIYS